MNLEKKRKLFEHCRVKNARNRYVTELQALSPETLVRHQDSLQKKLKELQEQHAETEKKHKENSSAITVVQLHHLNSELATINRAIGDLRDIPDAVLTKLKNEAEKVVQAVNHPDNAMLTSDGRLAEDYINNIYRHSRDDTVKRYAELDKWYALGNEFAINREDKGERAYHLALIPPFIQHLKWRFMISLADAAFDINFSRSHPDRLDDSNLTLLSRLYARLSQHERGADNPHMPASHKLRHNPAIHSLHVVALADKIFHEADQKINGKASTALRERWREIRKQVMQAALVHDCGEMDGELSQGYLVAGMDAKAKMVFDEARNRAEFETFERHLEESKKYLRHMEGGNATALPITEQEWTKIKQSYINSFELAEHTDSFLGRFIKTLERMQSQHDYLRFEGINGAPRLSGSTTKNKEFSMNYVPKFYRDANWDDPAPGKMALSVLASSAKNAEDKQIFEALTQALDVEYGHLMNKMHTAYGVPKPMTLRDQAEGTLWQGGVVSQPTTHLSR